ERPKDGQILTRCPTRTLVKKFRDCEGSRHFPGDGRMQTPLPSDVICANPKDSVCEVPARSTETGQMRWLAVSSILARVICVLCICMLMTPGMAQPTGTDKSTTEPRHAVAQSPGEGLPTPEASRTYTPDEIERLVVAALERHTKDKDVV